MASLAKAFGVSLTCAGAFLSVRGHHVSDTLELVDSRMDLGARAEASVVSLRDTSMLVARDSLVVKVLDIGEGGLLTHPPMEYAQLSETYEALHLIADTVRVSAGAFIDVTGKGYPDGIVVGGDTADGVAVGTGSSRVGGDHGGASNTTYKPYDIHLLPRLPGSGGGEQYVSAFGPVGQNARGGGVINSAAKVVILNGSLLADGQSGIVEAQFGGFWGIAGSAAGGSVQITADSLIGIGRISASAREPWDSRTTREARGGGGRAAIYTRYISDTIRTRIEVLGRGAGTVVLADRDGNGMVLLSDNGGSDSPDSSTWVTSVGTGVITYLTEDTLECDTCHFPSYHAVPGLRGMLVDVDRYGPRDGSTEFRIQWNDSTRLVVDTSGGRSLLDVTGFDREFQGIIRVDTLIMRGGARGYTHDANGMRTSMEVTGGPYAGQHEYEYDPAYQIVQATHPTPPRPLEEFDYDPVGNWLDGGRVHNELNQLTEDDSCVYEYDADGNMALRVSKTTGDSIRYTWNIENRLVRVDMPNGDVVEFVYGPLGRRLAKVVNGVRKEFRYDGEDLIIEMDGVDSVVASFTFGPGIDQPMAMRRNGKNYYYLA